MIEVKLIPILIWVNIALHLINIRGLMDTTLFVDEML